MELTREDYDTLIAMVRRVGLGNFLFACAAVTYADRNIDAELVIDISLDLNALCAKVEQAQRGESNHE